MPPDVHTFHGQATTLPLRLADLHVSLRPGDLVTCRLDPTPDDSWCRQRALDLMIGAGFSPDQAGPVGRSVATVVDATRIHSLPDTVAPGMRLLIVGLNPSPFSADSAIAYGHPGNRFWPAALQAGIVSVDRDPRHAISEHGLGMTDLVRRTTTRAAEVDRDEFARGYGRVGRLVAWLAPKAVCFVGLGGWRSVVDRSAVAGIQEHPLGGRPVYLMPHTSGLNANSRLADLAAHLAAAADLADGDIS